MVSKSLAGVPAITNHTTDPLQRLQGLMGEYRIAVQQVLGDGQLAQFDLPTSFQLLSKLQQSIRLNAVGAEKRKQQKR